MSGLRLPPLGVILLPFVAQPVLMFGLSTAWLRGLGVLVLRYCFLVFFAGEELAFIYAIFALMTGLLFGLVRAS